MVEGGGEPGLEIDILIEGGDWRVSIPTAQDIASTSATAALRDVTGMALAGSATDGASTIELSILLTDDAAIAELNSRWRGKTGPTNVLSFPAETDDGTPAVPPVTSTAASTGAPVLLGDVAVALETLLSEAQDAGIAPENHLHHLIVHGVLHLCGHDHENDTDADRMERLEIGILQTLGVSDPYAAAQRRLEEARP